MINHIRLDERLIHGQVAIKWSRHTGVNRIIVANDDAAKNPIIQKSLMMAAPTTAKVAIKTVEDAVTLLNDPRCEALKIMVIVSNPKDLKIFLPIAPSSMIVSFSSITLNLSWLSIFFVVIK